MIRIPVKDLAKLRIPADKLGRVGRGRRPVQDMNGLEQEYANLLELRRHAGEILWWVFEGMTFKLADNTRYTPDFALMLASGEIEIHETKGHWEDDARVKIKVAAALFPFRFVGIRKRPKKDGGGWATEEF